MELAEVNELKNRVTELEHSLSAAKAAWSAAQIAYNMEHLGLSKDSILVFREKRYYFCRVTSSESLPWVYGNPVRKDGTRALNEVCLWDDWIKEEQEKADN